MVKRKSVIVGSGYSLAALMIITSLIIAPTVSPQVVSVEPNDGITETDFLGEVYIFSLADNNSTNFSLNHGYKNATLDVVTYYTNSTGLDHEGLGGGSSSIVSEFNKSTIVLEDGDKKKINFNDQHVVALVDIKPKDYNIYSKDKGPQNLTWIIFLAGILLLLITTIILVEI